MTRQMKKVDAVVVGLGWTGSLMAMELAEAGLNVLALERGKDRKTVPDFAYPKVADELRYAIRYDLMQRPANSTLTIRHTKDDTALPYRQLGSFLPGTGVGGAGVHWNGMCFRPMAEELKLKSYVTETFGASVIPDGMAIQDFGVTYEELEPYFDRFEKIAGISGRAGNVNGTVQTGGNPFEAPRSAQYPLPPLQQTLNGVLFAEAAQKLGYHPYPRPAANASEAYTNPYGMQLGPCNFCGYCERFGCFNYSKASPQTCILDALKQRPNFAYKTEAEVLRVALAPDGKTATGVYYADRDGGEVFQPADIVILAAYQLHNVHLMLLSGIGPPYDADAGVGTVGKNYSYQVGGGFELFFNEKHFNPFIGTGANGMVIDDFAVNRIDFAKEGFIGGGFISTTQSSGRPIHNLPLPPGTPDWGAGWKKAVGQYYGRSMAVGMQGSNMSYRGCFLDLDPTYKDRHGRALLRMTFDWHPNEVRLSQYFKPKIAGIVDELGPDQFASGFLEPGEHYNTHAYQSTHNIGGAVMGRDPGDSALNRYLQSWDVHNVFVVGANAFPQNIQYNPTGLAAALTLWAARAIREDYLRAPRPLM